MTTKRTLIISRTYDKGQDQHQLFVAHISSDEIAGAVYQYEIWLNNQEQVQNRMTSGNKYQVRRALIQKLLDLQDEGWERRGSATYAPVGELRFFDPADL
jgi:hypothetical protein